MPPKCKKERKQKPSPLEAGASASKSRALKRRDTEAQVERIISNQFRDLTSPETDAKTDDAGRTLRDRLLEEKRRLRDTKSRISATFLSQLRKTFTSADSCFGSLRLPEEQERARGDAH